MARTKGARRVKRTSILAEQSFFGADPATLGTKFDTSRVGIMHALSWYARFADISDGRKWIDLYMEKHKFSKSDRQRFALADLKYVTTTMCAIANITNHGIKLPAAQIKFLNDRIKTAVDSVSARTVAVVNSAQHKTIKHIDTVDEIVDRFYNADYDDRKINIEQHLHDAGVKAHHLQPLINHVKQLAAELALIGKDADITEGYSNLSKKQVRAFVKFIDRLIEALRAYGKSAVVVSKKIRRPRKKKVKSAAHLARKAKVALSDKRTGIKGLDPAEVVGASTVFLYHTSWNKITKLVADDKQLLSIKGSTIIGFVDKLSVCKRARKAAPILKKIQSAGKVELRKVLDTIKTKPIKVSGRLNDKVLIIRVVK